MKVLKLLLEGILPIPLTRQNHLKTVEYFSKFSNLEDAIKDASWLEQELLNNFHTLIEDGKHLLKSIELFRRDGDDSSPDAFADFESQKIVFTKEFSEYEFANKLYVDGKLIRSVLREFVETVDHEMVHFIQYGGGAFQYNHGPRDNQTISKDYHQWYDGKMSNAAYDFHSMTTNEVQAWAVQVATGAINEILDSMLEGEKIDHHFKSFKEFYDHVTKLPTVAKKMKFSRLNGTPFSTKDPAEKRSLSLLHKWFLKTLQDFYYGGDDRRPEYDAAIEKGEIKRELKFSRK